MKRGRRPLTLLLAQPPINLDETWTRNERHAAAKKAVVPKRTIAPFKAVRHSTPTLPVCEVRVLAGMAGAAGLR